MWFPTLHLQPQRGGSGNRPGHEETREIAERIRKAASYPWRLREIMLMAEMPKSASARRAGQHQERDQKPPFRALSVSAAPMTPKKLIAGVPASIVSTSEG